MVGRIGAKVQVVIPKALRDRARLQPGDEVYFELRDEEIVLVTRRSPPRLGGRLGTPGRRLVCLRIEHANVLAGSRISGRADRAPRTRTTKRPPTDRGSRGEAKAAERPALHASA
jgi:AbrB family looped-hinge helix DNA binding protein